MIDMSTLRSTLADTVRLAIGSDLSQQNNGMESYGTVLQARPNPKGVVPEYPYAVIDLISVRDVDGDLLRHTYLDALSGIEWETHKEVSFQVSIFGSQGMELSNKLNTAYRMPHVREPFRNVNAGLLDTEVITSNPETYDTNFVERGIFLITLNVSDTYVDTDAETGAPIEVVNSSSELSNPSGVIDPVPVTVSVDSTP